MKETENVRSKAVALARFASVTQADIDALEKRRDMYTKLQAIAQEYERDALSAELLTVTIKQAAEHELKLSGLCSKVLDLMDAFAAENKRAEV